MFLRRRGGDNPPRRWPPAAGAQPVRQRPTPKQGRTLNGVAQKQGSLGVGQPFKNDRRRLKKRHCY